MNYQHLTTERLDLTAVSFADLAELHTLHADPRVWTHLPSGVHTTEQRTRADLEAYTADWERDGLGYWTARRRDDGDLVGIGGVRLRPTGTWNLYYRLAPDHQGQGYAAELVRAAIEAATAYDAETPVVAYLLDHNEASRRTAERAGLEQVWRGPDRDVPGGVRLVYADRSLPPETVERLH
ncbi:GNAT family N-acetyltransferase [Aeromicrobium choanae]|uniref:Protein N-acetyltransferase, RimJ/RimL family n=1 Tax=Aeromicrobium choanae TaxID=1736691 RepID=A0A1T4YP77_9ACTN|nr:GNAT family N-acetyltransferase [Aeromicrobium choanae]SKB03556.1 Protein N-acetyltransferase, RimJ/RimL family [Aeromicrobium choanae]